MFIFKIPIKEVRYSFPQLPELLRGHDERARPEVVQPGAELLHQVSPWIFHHLVPGHVPALLLQRDRGHQHRQLVQHLHRVEEGGPAQISESDCLLRQVL
jgi:hypothetical protein